jgi:hypothetical protein
MRISLAAPLVAATPRNNPNRLLGRRIALPEHRGLDRLALQLEADGATVMRYSLMATLAAPDPAPILVWLHALAAGAFDDVIFLTGEGVSRQPPAPTRRRGGHRTRRGRRARAGAYDHARPEAGALARGARPHRGCAFDAAFHQGAHRPSSWGRGESASSSSGRIPPTSW